jgi:hypothetical protein
MRKDYPDLKAETPWPLRGERLGQRSSSHHALGSEVGSPFEPGSDSLEEHL